MSFTKYFLLNYPNKILLIMIENFKNEKPEIDKKLSQDEKSKNERRQPIDMKFFWKNIDENYFKNARELNLQKINHVLMNLSYYGINILLKFRGKKRF